MFKLTYIINPGHTTPNKAKKRSELKRVTIKIAEIQGRYETWQSLTHASISGCLALYKLICFLSSISNPIEGMASKTPIAQ